MLDFLAKSEKNPVTGQKVSVTGLRPVWPSPGYATTSDPFANRLVIMDLNFQGNEELGKIPQPTIPSPSNAMDCIGQIMSTMETKLREHLINETRYDREKWRRTSEENDKLLKALRESCLALEESKCEKEALLRRVDDLVKTQHRCPHHHVQPVEIYDHVVEAIPQMVLPSDRDDLRSKLNNCWNIGSLSGKQTMSQRLFIGLRSRVFFLSFFRVAMVSGAFTLVFSLQLLCRQ
jgi:hypothetical protein